MKPPTSSNYTQTTCTRAISVYNCSLHCCLMSFLRRFWRVWHLARTLSYKNHEVQLTQKHALPNTGTPNKRKHDHTWIYVQSISSMQVGSRLLRLIEIPARPVQSHKTRTPTLRFTATMSPRPAPRSFAPLGAPQMNSNAGGEQLKGVVFDMDGTLCKKSYLSTTSRNANNDDDF